MISTTNPSSESVSEKEKEYEIFRTGGIEWLQKYVGKHDEVIDLGCGTMPLTRRLKCKKIIGIDAWNPYLEELEKSCSESEHFGLWNAEINDKFLSEFDDNSFHICLSIDFIEHLDKGDALGIIKQMERIASKRIIIFTPIGFVPQVRKENPGYQKHRCGFYPKELEFMGYETFIRIGGDVPSFLAVKELNN